MRDRTRPVSPARSEKTVTPVEVIEAALREHLRLRLSKRALTDAMLDKPIMLSGSEAEDAARIAVDALKAAALLPEGQVAVSAADLILALAHPAGLTRQAEYAAHLNAKDRLLASARAALPERIDCA